MVHGSEETGSKGARHKWRFGPVVTGTLIFGGICLAATVIFADGLIRATRADDLSNWWLAAWLYPASITLGVAWMHSKSYVAVTSQQIVWSHPRRTIVADPTSAKFSVPGHPSGVLKYVSFTYEGETYECRCLTQGRRKTPRQLMPFVETIDSLGIAWEWT